MEGQINTKETEVMPSEAAYTWALPQAPGWRSTVLFKQGKRQAAGGRRQGVGPSPGLLDATKPPSRDSRKVTASRRPAPRAESGGRRGEGTVCSDFRNRATEPRAGRCSPLTSPPAPPRSRWRGASPRPRHLPSFSHTPPAP